MAVNESRVEPKIRIPWGRNAASLLPLTAFLYTGYQLSNRIHVFDPRELPLTGLDHAIPFLLWTVWPYFLLIVLLFLPLGIRDRALYRRALWAFTFAVTINIVVWMVWPTIYPRPPKPEDPGLTGFAYRWLVSIDTPANCLPSGHITSPVVGCWALSREHPKHRVWIWPSLILLSFTILTTKQHYVWDLPAGVLSACIGIWLSGWVAAPETVSVTELEPEG